MNPIDVAGPAVSRLPHPGAFLSHASELGMHTEPGSLAACRSAIGKPLVKVDCSLRTNMSGGKHARSVLLLCRSVASCLEPAQTLLAVRTVRAPDSQGD